MKVKLNRKLIIGLVIALCATVAVSYVRAPADERQAAPQSDQSGDAGRQQTMADQLRELLAPVGVQVSSDFQTREGAVARQMKVHWQSAAGGKTAAATDQAAGSFVVTNSRIAAGSLPRRRSVELAESQIMVAAVDAKGSLIWWQIMTDPRLLRAETVSDRGEISGQVLYRTDVEFTVDFPDDAAIKELRLFHPNWTGTRFLLTPLATLNVS